MRLEVHSLAPETTTANAVEESRSHKVTRNQSINYTNPNQPLLPPVCIQNKPNPLTFLLKPRTIWEKEYKMQLYKQAIKIVKQEYKNASRRSVT